MKYMKVLYQMLEGNKYSVSKQKKKGEFSVSQITKDILKKYGIPYSVNEFKGMLNHFPSRTIITGSPVNKFKQKHTKIYDLNEIAYCLGFDKNVE